MTGHRYRTRLSDDGRLLELLMKHGLSTNSNQLLLLLLLSWNRYPWLVWIGNGLNDSISLDLLNDPLLLLLTGHHVLLNHCTRVAAHLELLDSGWIHQASPHGHGHVIVRGNNSDGTFLGEKLRSDSHWLTHRGRLLYLLLHLLLNLLQVSRRQHIRSHGLHLAGEQLLLQLLRRSLHLLLLLLLHLLAGTNPNELL